MVDINNLRCLDKTTKAERRQRFHASLEYVYRLASVSRTLLDREFLAEEEGRLTDPLNYYDANIGPAADIFRMIITHPDMDHMTGLHRLHVQDPRKSLVNSWRAGDHDFNLVETTEEEWESCPYDKRDWETYKSLRAGNAVYSIHNRRGEVETPPERT